MFNFKKTWGDATVIYFYFYCFLYKSLKIRDKVIFLYLKIKIENEIYFVILKFPLISKDLSYKNKIYFCHLCHNENHSNDSGELFAGDLFLSFLFS